jgi:SPOR domain
MRIPDKDYAGPVYSDFRQLLALAEGRTSRKSGRFRRLRTFIQRGWESTAALLETRTGLCVGGCLFLVLLGVSASRIHEREQVRSVDTTTLETPVASTGAPVYRPASFEEDPHTSPPIEHEGAFVVRVGSFRDPANAARVAQSLRDQTTNVSTETVDGLHVVLLGPFSMRSAAEDAARALRRARGLSPQVVRQK